VKESIAELEMAKRLAPDNADTHLRLAFAYRKMGRSQDAGLEESAYASIKKREQSNAQSIAERSAQSTARGSK
jgi:hypothetical protein